ncbi:MAG: nickel-binding protein [Acidimicrobiia bacterium]
MDDANSKVRRFRSAADVAGAHQADLAHQDQYGVNCKSYWVHESNGKIFCLVDAPDSETAVKVQRGGARSGRRRDLRGRRRVLMSSLSEHRRF